MDLSLTYSIEAAARRHRARLMAGFFTRVFGILSAPVPRHAARPHLARQG